MFATSLLVESLSMLVTPMSEQMILLEVRDLFSRRCEEVSRYFDFLVNIDSSRATAIARFSAETGESLMIYEEVISRELIKTMRANGYLLLYNLVESTMTNAVDAIHKCFLHDECGFDELTNEIKAIVLLNFKKALSSGGQHILDHDHPIQRSIVELGYDKKKLFSGNLDAKEIKETAERYGFRIAHHDLALSRGGARLLKVKEKRNELAHGRISFEDCGHETSLDELVEISKETEIYLGAVLSGIEDYIAQRSYRSAI